MAEDQTKRYVQYLVDRVNNAELDNRAMYLVLEDFLKGQQEMRLQMTDLQNRQSETDIRLAEKRQQVDKKRNRMTGKMRTSKDIRNGQLLSGGSTELSR